MVKSLMVGQTGTGKTTLINTMVNYILGVKFEDKVYFEITEEKKRDQSESQTSEVTVYEIASEKNFFFLTIIDTAGYGDTRGIDEDEKIAQNLNKLFQHETGVKDLDAVCLVLKASENRISDAQRYIFQSVLSLFGKDIKDNIVLFITHSDGGHPTNVLEAVKKEKILCCKDDEKEPVFFLFNNRQAEKLQEKYKHNSKASWEMGDESLEDFFEFLKSRPTKSVGLSATVLQERIQIEACIRSCKQEIKHIEEKEKALTEIQNQLKKHKGNIEKNENALFTVTTVYKEKVPVKCAKKGNRYVASCNTCEVNCHMSCTAKYLSKCKIFKAGALCSVCKCPQSKHVKGRMKYVTRNKCENVTYKDLITKYSNKQGAVADKRGFQNMAAWHGKELNEKANKMNLESCLKQQLDECKNKKKLLVKEAYEAIIKLWVAALRPDSAFTLKYLDFLITRVEEIGESEWAQKLKQMQKEAETESNKLVMEYIDLRKKKERH